MRQTNYDDDFKVLGKRLIHVEGINGKKIYIGVKSMREQDVVHKPGDIKYPNWYEQHQKIKEGENFLPIEDSHGKSKNMISTFEIEASYIKSNEADFLDLYQLEDDDYGI